MEFPTLVNWTLRFFRCYFSFTVKPALRGHSKKDKTKALKLKVQVGSITDCILQYFQPFFPLFKWPLKTGFTVYSNSNSIFSMQTVETLLRRLVWVCNVCLCPTKRMLGLYGLTLNLLLPSPRSCLTKHQA